jgi:hypothetical protein
LRPNSPSFRSTIFANFQTATHHNGKTAHGACKCSAGID